MDISDKKALSLDHVLVTIHDYAKTYQQYQQLGFAPTQISYHPWGTATSLLVLQSMYIELIGVDDARKFGTNEVNGFCFGRRIGEFLAKGEDGISMISLHSKNTPKDYVSFSEHHESQGIVDFSRTIKMADGTLDKVVVTIGLCLDSQYPEASSFLCHQHRPDLIWVDEWAQHPNGAQNIAKVTYVTEQPEILATRWRKDYVDAVQILNGVVSVDTGDGVLVAMNHDQLAHAYGDIDLPISNNQTPHVEVLTITVTALQNAANLLEANGVTFAQDSQRILISPQWTGNIIIELVEA